MICENCKDYYDIRAVCNPNDKEFLKCPKRHSTMLELLLNDYETYKKFEIDDYNNYNVIITKFCKKNKMKYWRDIENVIDLFIENKKNEDEEIDDKKYFKGRYFNTYQFRENRIVLKNMGSSFIEYKVLKSRKTYIEVGFLLNDRIIGDIKKITKPSYFTCFKT